MSRLSESDRHAQRQHTEAVARHDETRRQERQRLILLHQDRLDDFQRLMEEDRDLPREQVVEIDRAVNDGLLCWDREHPLDRFPDTPAKLLNWIDQTLQVKARGHAQAHPSGQPFDLDDPWLPDDEVRNLYNKAMGRALRFADITPGIRDDDRLQEADDPRRGLAKIEDLCREILVDRPTATPSTAPPEAPPVSDAPANTSPTLAPAADPLTLDDRAVALINQRTREGRPLKSIREVARVLDCHHSSLSGCPSFRHLWEMSQGAPRRGYRSARTGGIEAIDDD